MDFRGQIRKVFDCLFVVTGLSSGGCVVGECGESCILTNTNIAPDLSVTSLHSGHGKHVGLYDMHLQEFKPVRCVCDV
jgi:hypothetical protein